MTAIRIGARSWGPAIVLLLALGVCWAAAAYFLLETRVPDGLDLPRLSAADFYPARVLERADDYERFHRVSFLLSSAATVVVFALYAWRGARFTRESAAGPIGTGMLLAMLGFALVWLVNLPFAIAGYWWDRRYDVADGSYWELIFGSWILLGVEFLFLSLAVLIVMGLARLVGRLWFIPGAVAFVGLAALFAFVYPYLVTDTRPLRDPQLAAAARQLAKEEGVSDVPVEVEDVSDRTNAANAYAAGLGSSRKVFLWNTLLDGRFSDGEVRFVLAHEFAHLARDHLLKAIAWYALFALPGAFLIAVVANHRGGMGAPEAVPLALFVLVILSLVATPLQAAISRRMEAEADWVALETTRDPRSAIRLFQEFSETSLSDPTPPGWSYWLAEDHPSLLQRIEMAEAWRERQRGR
jgi:STE24 endopeptidase